MDVSGSNVIKKVNENIIEDLSRIKIYLNQSDEANSDKKTTQHNEFVKYLVSVATHPIGLRASLEPFNSCQEHMLAYIIDMFSLNDNDVKRILSTKQDVKRDVYSQLENRRKKRHSWRAELRIRLGAPSFFYKEQVYLDNLYVRVYLFKEQSFTSIENNAKTSQRLGDDGNGLLERVFSRMRLSPSLLIRPVNEMTNLVKFEPSLETDHHARLQEKASRPQYKMVQLVKDGFSKIEKDIHISIRRYYCEPATVHILRFEFWLDTMNTKSNWLNKYKSCVKNLVYNGCQNSSCAGRKSTTYMNERQEFYGYINLKLTQLAAYATKQSHPILSLDGDRLNNCEITIEPRNRRIMEEEEGDNLSTGSIASSSTKDFDYDRKGLPRPKKSSESFVINHMRLYINCLLYQIELIGRANLKEITESEAFQDITLDNLLYVPAYSLINQHRLQSNLSQIEDQCLRRVSLLLLLMKLEELKFTGTTKASLRIYYMRAILISLVQNEYMVGHRSIDDKTLQEVDPFRNHSNQKTTRSIIVAVETSILKDFVENFLFKRLKVWLVSYIWATRDLCEELDHLTTLLGLKMLNAAILHYKKRTKNKRSMRNQNLDVKSIKGRVEKILSESFHSFFSSRIESILDSDENSPRNKRKRTLGHTSPKGVDCANPWKQLLLEIKQINHELSLYWSPEGLTGILNNKKNCSNEYNIESKLKKNLSGVVESKIGSYLR